jgi:membrane-bound PQQ-dependent dehydrogenase (glucose/quinate/shikimate family)
MDKKDGLIRRTSRKLLALLFLILGAALVAGGAQLAWLGGSAYYTVAGVMLVASAFLLWRGNRWGTRLYWLLLLGTVLWSLGESGSYFWPLLARTGLFAGLGLLLFLLELPAWAKRLPKAPLQAALVLMIGIPIMAASVSLPSRGSDPAPAVDAREEWRAYGLSNTGTRFSRLSQITPENVRELRPAWVYRSGDLAEGGRDPIDALGGLRGLYGISGLQSTPLQIADTLYTCTERGRVVALDAETGRERWRFDPKASTNVLTHSSCRGVSYHEQAGFDAPCAKRIFHGDIDAGLWALDARTGKPCGGFGRNGRVSLREGLSNPEIGYHMTSPGTVAKGVIVVGAWVADNQSTQAPSGVIRAYDVTTGALAWAWDMGRPESNGPPPAGSTYTPGTPNSWTFSSADEALNLVYVPLGNPSPDLWGGNRRPFDDRFSSSIVALDLTTGRLRWSFQTVHHDLWDYDVPAQPVLADLPDGRGGFRPALIQATKRGEIFVLDRATGKPIFPVEERPAPQGAAHGDRTAPTQPYSSISVRPPDLTEAQMWGVTPLDQLWCRIAFRKARYEGLFTPPGERPTINHPGSFGSISWGGVTIDESRSILVSNKSAVAHYMQLIPRDKAPESARRRTDPTSYQWLPMENTPYVSRIRPFISPLDIPCNQPPWGNLEAIDLKTGRSLWKRVLGTSIDNGPLGYRTGLGIPIGVPSQGGAITTETGLTFIAATADNYLRAFETGTGRELWKGRLPAGGQATPMTYRSPRTGRQFVLIAAGGHPGLRSLRGDHIIAFALPDGQQGMKYPPVTSMIAPVTKSASLDSR